MTEETSHARQRYETIEDGISEILHRLHNPETLERVRKAVTLGAEDIELRIKVTKSGEGTKHAGKWCVCFKYEEKMKPDQPWTFVALT